MILYRRLTIFDEVPGVGFENSLRITMNSSNNGEGLKYRIFISEVGTTVSKVKIEESS